MKVLIGKTITDAMLTSSTVAEPAASETAWAASTVYAVGDKRIRATTHRVYRCAIAHTSAASPLPEADPTRWVDDSPTLKWAAFDNTVSTQTRAVNPLVMVFRPGFFVDVAVYGADAAAVSASVKDAPGGAVIFSQSISLLEDPLDWWDWAFGDILPIEQARFTGIVPYPDAELTLTFTAAASVSVGVGVVLIGTIANMLDQANLGGVQYGASAELVDYSRIKVDPFGNTTIVKGRDAQDMRFTVILPQANAEYARAIARRALAVPALWISTDVKGYDGLSVFGLGSGSLSYEGPTHAKFTGIVKGLT